MVVRISSSVLAAILDHAASVPDREVCGLLFGSDAAIDAAQPAANVHAHPAGHFEIDPVALIAAHKAQRAGGPRLVGHYHSHPSGSAVPSQEDVQGAESGRLCMIVADGTARLYRATDGTLQPVEIHTGGASPSAYPHS